MLLLCSDKTLLETGSKPDGVPGLVLACPMLLLSANRNLESSIPVSGNSSMTSWPFDLEEALDLLNITPSLIDTRGPSRGKF